MPSKIRLRDWDQVYQRAAKMDGVDQLVRRALERYVPPIAGKVWTEQSVLQHARTRMDRAALAGTRVRASARSATLTAATAPRIPGLDPGAVEFGDGARTYETYQGRRGATTFRVRRRTQQQLPARARKGRVVYRYAPEAMRRLMAAYSQTILRTLSDVLEGK